jgi:hypothetical protein
MPAHRRRPAGNDEHQAVHIAGVPREDRVHAGRGPGQWDEIDRIGEFAQRVKQAINQANKTELVELD